MDACLNFVYFPAETNLRQSAKFYKSHTWSPALLFLRKNLVYWIESQRELIENSLIFTEKVILNKNKKNWTKKVLMSSAQMMKDVFQKIKKIEFKKISDQKLLSLYQEILDEYYYFWTIWSPIEMMTFGLEELIRKKLKHIQGELERKNAMSILTSTSRLTFYRRENKELFKIALIKNPIKQKEALRRHSQKYFWMLNNYKDVKILDLKYFEKKLEKIKTQINLKEIKKSFAEIQTYPQQIKKDKERIIKKYGLSLDIKYLSFYLSECIFWQDLRKEYTLMSHHYLNLILMEISGRYSISLNNLKYLTPLEVKYLLLVPQKKKFFLKKIQRRKEGGVFSFTLEKTIEIIDKKTKKEFFDFYIDKKNIDKKREKQIGAIEGNLACAGPTKYFRGQVRVVKSIRELHKIRKDDILVTAMTSPDYIVAIKRAGAIITMKAV